MNIKQILGKEVLRLKENSIIDVRIKARILLAFVLNVKKEYLVINQDKEINEEKQTAFEKSIDRLIQGEPLQHITGKQEFMKMEFIVNKYVLIPRPDTEILVEEVIDLLKKMKEPKVLDLCTGSGAIGISLIKYIKGASVLATDISIEALKIAKKNAENLLNYKGLLTKIKFLKSDLFENIKYKFNLIVSNPPYIEKEKINRLHTEVQNEPIIALDGGIDGLDFYRKIISEAHKYLESKGYLCLEIGYNQKEEIIKLIKDMDEYEGVYSKKDLAGNDRIIICNKK